MADWLEHSVQVDVERNVAVVWALWSDLEQMPRWMKWIEAVKIDPQNPENSDWLLGSGGFTFTWKSRILKKTTNQIIQWESIDGLPNRGAIRFYGRNDGTSSVKLSVSYNIPGAIGQIMDNLFLGKIVESTLQADLARFKAIAESINPVS
jgi:uncharacterized membrane protein